MMGIICVDPDDLNGNEMLCRRCHGVLVVDVEEEAACCSVCGQKYDIDIE